MTEKIYFLIYGHTNILATHKTTFELTKDSHLSKEGDCIIGVKADFSLEKLKNMIKDKDEIQIKISVDELHDEIKANVNKSFNDENEIVVRLGEYPSSRTLGVRADKAAIHLNRKLIEKLKDPGTIAKVEIS